MLFPAPVLADADRKVLEGIEAARQKLRHQVQSAPSKWTEGLRKFLTADAVAASNSIEGFRVSTIDVEDLLEGERDVDVSDENREETLACRRMMTYIQTLHDVEDFCYSIGFLNALHWMLQGHRHTPRKPAGQWRRGPVYVTDARDPSIAAYTAPTPTVLDRVVRAGSGQRPASCPRPQRRRSSRVFPGRHCPHRRRVLARLAECGVRDV